MTLMETPVGNNNPQDLSDREDFVIISNDEEPQP
jgi:hypothetical protein